MTYSKQEALRNYKLLRDDLSLLHLRWELYLGLFSHPESNRLITDHGQVALQLIELSLRESITLAVTRMLDPAKTASKDNLTLYCFFDHFNDIPQFSKALNLGTCLAQPLSIYRNKEVGHNDYAVATGKAELKAVIDKDLLESILHILDGLINVISISLTGNEATCFHPNSSGVSELVQVIAEGRNSIIRNLTSK